tara:strand:+ start:209 stop:328 length:120 start_codon:yes stop_codon:yes gene_type:complete
MEIAHVKRLLSQSKIEVRKTLKIKAYDENNSYQTYLDEY